jgi:hypothetical protein
MLTHKAFTPVAILLISAIFKLQALNQRLVVIVIVSSNVLHVLAWSDRCSSSRLDAHWVSAAERRMKRYVDSPIQRPTEKFTLRCLGSFARQALSS